MMQVFKYPVTINLWLGNSSCTLFDYDLNGIREQLLTLLRQLEVITNNDNSYEVNVVSKLDNIATTYSGNNRDEVISTIRQILNLNNLCYKDVLGNDVLGNLFNNFIKQ